MTEEAIMDEEEYGGIYDHMEQKWIDPTTIGGRGGTRKTHTGAIDAVHRTLGHVHPHPENGGIIRKEGSDTD
jgi:hypothetical protein